MRTRGKDATDRGFTAWLYRLFFILSSTFATRVKTDDRLRGLKSVSRLLIGGQKRRRVFAG